MDAVSRTQGKGKGECGGVKIILHSQGEGKSRWCWRQFSTARVGEIWGGVKDLPPQPG